MGEFSVMWFSFGLFIGVLLGTTTLALMSSTSSEDDLEERFLHELRKEWFMQRLYLISLEVKGETQEQRLEEYRKMVGCEWCNNRIQVKSE